MSHVQPVRLTALARPFWFFSFSPLERRCHAQAVGPSPALAQSDEAAAAKFVLYFFFSSPPNRTVDSTRHSHTRVTSFQVGRWHNASASAAQLVVAARTVVQPLQFLLFFFFSLFLFPQSPNARIFPGIDFQFESDAGVRAKPLRKSILVYEHTL